MVVKLSEEMVEKLLNKVNEGERVIAHCVPTRAFRVVMLEDGEKTFRVEQLSRQHGDKWIPVSTHTGTFKWEAYDTALTRAVEANREFMLEMRKLKVQQNQALRAAGAGAQIYVPE